jgi:transcriptional regulator of arginine metabolism
MELRGLVRSGRIRSQEQAVELLKVRGYAVTQATVSRDLQAIGAVKPVAGGNEAAYVLRTAPDDEVDSSKLERLRETFSRHVLELIPSGNLLVITTLPAGAGPVAAVLDAVRPEGLAGTVAGDDTVLAVTLGSSSGKKMRKLLMGFLEE